MKEKELQEWYEKSRAKGFFDLKIFVEPNKENYSKEALALIKAWEAGNFVIVKSEQELINAL